MVVGRWLGVLLLLLGLSWHAGCGGSGGRSILPEVTGGGGQVLVIASSQLKETPVGDTLRRLLGVEYPYIPQSEPSFGLTFITESAFERVLHPFRNILWLRAHPDSALGLRVERNRWSSGQLVVHASGPSWEVLAEGLSAHGGVLFGLFAEAERDRYVAGHRRLRSEGIDGYLRSKHGVSMTVPSTYGVRADRPGFTWLSVETRDISQGVLVYSSALRGGDFARDTLVARRNGFTSRYVPGPNEGTYMVVSEVVPPALELLGDTLVRMRGFWEVRGHAMGGAFVSYSRLSRSGDSVVTCEGYIYAPSKRKREYMRELEAMLGTAFAVR